MVRAMIAVALCLVSAWLLAIWSLADKPADARRSDQQLLGLRRHAAVRKAHRRWRRRQNISAAPEAPAAGALPPAHSSSWPSNCPASRRPYHVLLTASAGVYQAWQTRLLYYHYVRLRRQQPCSDMGGFTRLLTTPGAAPDALMKEIPTVIVAELTATETMGFVVLNRPNSLLVALGRGELKFAESYVFLAETDHLLMRVLPNTATPTNAIAYPFHYMNPNRDENTRSLVRRFAGSDEVAKRVQQVGPSPLLVHADALRQLVKPWHELSFRLKRDPAADAEFGWMLEMWGYSIGAALAGACG